MSGLNPDYYVIYVYVGLCLGLQFFADRRLSNVPIYYHDVQYTDGSWGMIKYIDKLFYYPFERLIISPGTDTRDTGRCTVITHSVITYISRTARCQDIMTYKQNKTKDPLVQENYFSKINTSYATCKPRILRRRPGCTLIMLCIVALDAVTTILYTTCWR